MNQKQVREWARAQGITVGKRGRLNQDVLRKYAEAHPSAVSQ